MENNTIDLTPMRDLLPKFPKRPSEPYLVFVPPLAVLFQQRESRLRRVLRFWPILAVVVAVTGLAAILALMPDTAFRSVVALPEAAAAVAIPISEPMPEGEEEKEAGEVQGARPATPSSVSPAVPLFSPPAFSPLPPSSYTVKIGKPILKKKRAKRRKKIRRHPSIETVLTPPKPRRMSVADLISAAAPGEVKMRTTPKKAAAAAAAVLPPLSRRQIMTIMAEGRKNVSRCWDRFHVPGIVNTSFVILKSGKVSGLKILGIFSGTPTGACVAAAIGRLKFPKSKQPTRIKIPFVLR